MPPPLGRYAPQHMSNPFNHFNQHSIHAQQQQQPHHGGPAPQQQPQHMAQAAGPNYGSGAYSYQNPNGVGIFAPQGGIGPAGGFAGGMGAGVGGVGQLGGLPGGASGGTGLGSHGAQVAFAHGAQLQQQAEQQAGMGGAVGGAKGLEGRIRQVWKTNLAQEMALLRNLVDRYPYISMDTEFPGIVARPMGDFTSKANYHYQTVRCNVDLLKIIQLGITLFTPSGDLPSPTDSARPAFPNSAQNGLSVCPCTWTFNFYFDPNTDMYNDTSLQVLRKAGVDFDKHANPSLGIDPSEFGSLLITSGLVLSPDVHWLSFHCGYDVAYLFKLMWNQALPANEDEHNALVRKYFPNIWDIKFMLKHAQVPKHRAGLTQPAQAILDRLGQKSGLQDLAEELGCSRVGVAHSAGSDAWLTGMTFFAMRTKLFDNSIPPELNGMMWGLIGVGAPASLSTQQAVLLAQQNAQNPQQQQQQNSQQQVQNGGFVSQFGGMLGTGGGGLGAGFHTGLTPGGRGDAPSTPTPSGVELHNRGTPGLGGAFGTPGGGGFGNFSYGGK